MQLARNINIQLVIYGVVFFIAGMVQAGGVMEQWVARYNGPGNDYDGAYAMAVDGLGNVYVTGYSFGGSTGRDYATVKYDPNGNQKWASRYNGPFNNDDMASAITTDSSGNVYVTGSAPIGCYYATIKYDPNGSQLWVRSYNGPGTSFNAARAIAVDNLGNVYVTGGSSNSNDVINYDYATVKYDPNGNQKWAARYNGPGNSYDIAYAMAVDSSGNVYVTGYSIGSGTSEDYATIKYDPNGNQKWVARYNGLINSSDEAHAITLDGSGNIYVTGWSYGSISGPPGVDYATIKYDPNGNQKWVSRYNGSGNTTDQASAIAVTASGNVCVTGVSNGSGTGQDYATAQYDPNGAQNWVTRYDGPGNDSDYANAIAIDSSGNVYVTGLSPGSGTGKDYATIKYDPNGNQKWVARYNGPGNGYDEAHAIAVDSSGNVFVTGESYIGSYDTDYATIKYTQNPVILTMQTEPAEVNTVTPILGMHQFAQGTVTNVSAQRFVDCPGVYVFSHWVGAVADANAASTTVVMDNDQTIKAVFVDGRRCGDECHRYPAGDTNRDCKVNLLDIAVLANSWLACTDPTCD
jgi:uncharacterized delta-60 repeat protein